MQMKKIVLALIHWYQSSISPLKRHGCCRFLPTCSEYAYLSIERFGVIKGGWLAICRLARCHPLCPGGFDPVPKKFAWRRKNRH